MALSKKMTCKGTLAAFVYLFIFLKYSGWLPYQDLKQPHSPLKTHFCLKKLNLRAFVNWLRVPLLLFSIYFKWIAASFLRVYVTIFFITPIWIYAYWYFGNMCCHILNGAHTIRLYSWALNVTKLWYCTRYTAWISINKEGHTVLLSWNWLYHPLYPHFSVFVAD